MQAAAVHPAFANKCFRLDCLQNFPDFTGEVWIAFEGSSKTRFGIKCQPYIGNSGLRAIQDKAK
jgi:hypothetical protein